MRPDGKEGEYNVIESARSVIIVAVTNEAEIVFIEQFRYPTQMDSLEIPAGGIDEGEDPIDAGKRELLEETGLRAKKWRNLGELQMSNSKTDGIGTVLWCTDLEETGEHEQEEEGITGVFRFTVPEVLGKIASGQITDATTLAPLLLYFAHEGIEPFVHD